jgi:inward rectifier potassium channel
MRQSKKKSKHVYTGRARIVPRGEEDGFTIIRTGARLRRGDFYVKLLAASWRRLFVLFIASFLFVNAVFAFVYFTLGGVENAHSFADAFFFSVQTLSTIGYVKMAPVSLAANLVVTVEVMMGILFAALAMGLVFAKFSRPTARVLFSNVAIINSYNGRPHLMFRVANQRDNGIVDARIQVVLLRKETSSEGHKMRRFHDMVLIRRQMPVLQLSWTVMHPIDENSPLYKADAEKLKEWDAEIIVSMAGIDETFSQTVHARHSYIADDLVYDAVFVDVVKRREEDNGIDVDLSKLHDVRRLAAGEKS